MADVKEKENDIFKEASSPKVINKKDKKKYHAFRSDDDDSSEQDEAEVSIAKLQKHKKDRNSFKVKIKNIKGKKKDKEKKKKVKKNVLNIEDVEDGAVTRELIFGVPLELAVERSAFPDKIALPRIVRDCIQHIEETGLETEGLYRVSGVKSKVDQLKQLYDEGKPVNLSDVDPCATSSLLKLYLRELPSSVLTTRLAPIFDSCVGLDDVNEQVKRFQQLINDLPCPNRTLLAWLFTHFNHVMQKHSANKMSIQNLTIVFSPTMSISHGVLNIFFEHTDQFFPDTELVRYIPPLKKEDNEDYPEAVIDLQDALRENEKILADLHDRVNQGCQDEAVMEELWDRQRRSTQIKRKIKVKIQKEKQMRENLALQEKENNLSTVSQKPEKLASESKELSLSQSSLSSKEELKRLNSKSTPKKSSDNSHRTVELVKSNIESEVPPQPNLDSVSKPKVLQSKTIERTGSVKSVSASQLDHMKKEIIEPERLNEEQTLSQTLQQQINAEFKKLLLEEQRLLFENEELLLIGELIQKKIQWEKSEVDRLKVQISEFENHKTSTSSSSCSSISSSFTGENIEQLSDEEEDNDELGRILEDLESRNKQLELESNDMIQKIIEECKLCAKLKAEIRLFETEQLVYS